MQISDLVAIGKLGKSIDSNGFIPFKQYRNFHLPVPGDVFLLFTDNRVRYVTITEIETKTLLKLKIDDEEILAEAAQDGNVSVLLPGKDSGLMPSQDFYGKHIYFRQEMIGIVSESFFNGAQEVIAFQDRQNKEILIPMVDAYVLEIDEDKIVLKNIEDFLEL